MLVRAPRRDVEEETWKSRVRDLSALFAPHKEIIGSSAEFFRVQGYYYLVNSEGTRLKVPESSLHFQARATALAADGMTLRDTVGYHALGTDDLPPEEPSCGAGSRASPRTSRRCCGRRWPSLTPDRCSSNRRPPPNCWPSCWAETSPSGAARLGARTSRPVRRPAILKGAWVHESFPEWMDVMDDPTAAEWHGRRLLGHYVVDLEGVVPQPLILVEKGLLRNFLTTRQPVKGAHQSNGRASLRGSFGANAASFGNLFVRASQSSDSAGVEEEAASILPAVARSPTACWCGRWTSRRRPPYPRPGACCRVWHRTASSRPVSLPLLAYRVYPDGREELVRGCGSRISPSGRSATSWPPAGNPPGSTSWRTAPPSRCWERGPSSPRAP